MKATLFFVLLCTSLVLINGQAAIKKFRASYDATESYVDTDGNNQERTFQGTLWYEDSWNAASNNGHQAIRYDIDLNSDFLKTTLTELSIYQDQFFKFTICNGQCAWQDIFAEEPFPKMYVNPGDTRDSTEAITVAGNSITMDVYNFDQTNVVGENYPDFTKIWVNPANNFVYRAVIKYNGGITRTLELRSQVTDFDSATIFRVPNNCPVIEPGCLRLDIIFVVDVSGSVANNVPQEFNFLRDVTQPLFISPKYFGVGLVTFSDCYNIVMREPLNYDKQNWMNRLDVMEGQTSVGGWTCIVGGVQRAFWLLAEVNGSRPATPKCVIVLTDGNGNKPCSPVGVIQDPQSQCATVTPGSLNPPDCCSNCIGTYRCDDRTCCRQLHDHHLRGLYNTLYEAYGSPKLFAIGVGDVTRASLNLVVNDPQALAAGRTNVFQVANFNALNTIVASLVAAILCDNPGTETCPNDCRPGGFCCAGGCLCTTDCAADSSECQQGYCKVNNAGAACALGPPDDNACQSLAFDKQCKDWKCIPDQGCVGTINDNLFCTDSNPCTDDKCENGVCVVDKNNVTLCSDNNECTLDDQCLPDGSCEGKPNDLDSSCDDGNECTTNRCSGTECVVSDTKTCTDDNTDDCITFRCNPANGECEPAPVKEGFQCRPPPFGDNCTVYVCERFDPDDYNECVEENNGDDSDCARGRCEQKTRDIDECKSSDDNIGAIIGGVVAGVAFIAIICLCALIFLLVLCRKQIPAALGVLNPFGGDSAVTTAPTYVPSASSGTSGLYQ